MNILLSYQHSGASWIRYMVEFVTKMPTIGGKNEPPIGKLYTMGVKLKNKYILYKKQNLLKKDINRDNKLILLIRNYKDVFVRQAVYRNEVSIDKVKEIFNNDYALYVSLINHYKEWPGEKLLLYYEDLINEPANNIHKLFNFLGVANKSYLFLSNYDRHFKCSLDIYKENHNYYETAAKESDNLLSYELRRHMDNLLMYYDPMVFAEYLSEYMEEAHKTD